MDGFEINEFGEIIRKNNNNSNNDYDIIIKEKRTNIDKEYQSLFQEYYKEAQQDYKDKQKVEEQKRKEKIQAEKKLEQDAKKLMKSYDDETEREKAYNKALENKKKADEEFKKEQEKLDERRKKTPKKNKVKRIVRDAIILGITISALAGLKAGLDTGFITSGAKEKTHEELMQMYKEWKEERARLKASCDQDELFDILVREGKLEGTKRVRLAGYASLNDYAEEQGYKDYDDMYESMLNEKLGMSGVKNGR